jgi:sulfoxide reductase heme-binding subunit YedZ
MPVSLAIQRQARLNKLFLHVAAKPVVLLLGLLPFAYLLGSTILDQLGANPAQALVRATGSWSLRLLCVVLALTPLRVLTGNPALARFRRMLGLFVYFYVALHLLCYAGFDMAFDLADITNDITKRLFILVGFASFLLLSTLALTSFNRAIKALGGKNWQRLHSLVYVVAGLAILHFYWMRAGKNNFAEVAVYAAILSGLLGWRLWHRFNRAH